MTDLELKEAILQLDIKPNTVIFVDRNAIDTRRLANVIAQMPPLDIESGGFFIPVGVAPGKTLSESVLMATVKQLREWARLAE